MYQYSPFTAPTPLRYQIIENSMHRCVHIHAVNLVFHLKLLSISTNLPSSVIRHIDWCCACNWSSITYLSQLPDAIWKIFITCNSLASLSRIKIKSDGLRFFFSSGNILAIFTFSNIQTFDGVASGFNISKWDENSFIHWLASGFLDSRLKHRVWLNFENVFRPINSYRIYLFHIRMECFPSQHWAARAMCVCVCVYVIPCSSLQFEQIIALCCAIFLSRSRFMSHKLTKWRENSFRLKWQHTHTHTNQIVRRAYVKARFIFIGGCQIVCTVISWANVILKAKPTKH